MNFQPSTSSPARDRFRQLLVLFLSFCPPVVTVLAFGTGTTFEEATRSEAGRPLIEPAGYAFVIWTLIYAGSIAYGVFQAFPSQARNELFRRIGPFTASAFLSTSLWLVMARFKWIWLTVACIVWLLASLAPVFMQLMRRAASLTTRERWLVALPFSVFTAWVTVATFANTAAAVKDSGWAERWLPEQAWTVMMLVIAGLIASRVTAVSRGNRAYASTVVWAMAAITVANLEPGQSALVAATAGVVAVCVAGTLLHARRTVSSNLS